MSSNDILMWLEENSVTPLASGVADSVEFQQRLIYSTAVPFFVRDIHLVRMVIPYIPILLL